MPPIKIAPLVPFSFMNRVSEFSDISLYLFHELENPDYSRGYWADRGYKIIDNGTFELGRPPKDRDYVKRSIELCPNEIVTPDLLGDYLETKRKTLEFLNKYHDLLSEQNIKLQTVTQADTLLDAIEYYISMNKDQRIHCIGLPFKMELKDGERKINREQFIEDLISKGIVSSKPHHLLGLSSLQEFIRMSKHKFIRSCDSSIFYRDARDGIEYGNGIPYEKSGPRINLQDPEDKKCLERLESNLKIIRQEILRE